MLYAKAGGNPQQNGMWKQSTNQPQWSSSYLIPPERMSWTSITMSISCGSWQGGQVVMRRQRPGHLGLLSRSAFSIGSLPHCQGQNWVQAQLTSLGLTHKPSSMPGSVPIMNGSWALSRIAASKPWPWPGMPTDRHWQPLHYWKKRLRGWADPSAMDARAVASTLEAASILVAKGGKEDLKLQSAKLEAPWQHPTMGIPPNGGLHHPTLGGGWPLKRRIPVSRSSTCQLREMKGCQATSLIGPIQRKTLDVHPP